MLAETVLQLKERDPNYDCQIISMESVDKWYEMAKRLLPDRYDNIVEIRLGKRQLYNYAMFRGYCHSNIPKLNYDFVFLDGPSYGDEFGSSACLDALKVRLLSNCSLIRGVIDTRVSTVMVMQSIFGTKAVRYYSILRTCSFNLRKINSSPNLRSWSFTNSVLGRVTARPKHFRQLFLNLRPKMIDEFA